MALVTLTDRDIHDGPGWGPGSEGALVIDGLPGYFRLFFQPELDLAGGEVVACEALLRWWHPEYGLLRPGASLHETRWSGRLGNLEQWAIESACRQAAAWERAGRPLRVAVNVSRRLVRDGGLPDVVAVALAATGVSPHLVGLDVPFASFARRPIPTRATAQRLRDLGVVVIADDVAGDLARAELGAGGAVSVLKIPIYVAGSRRPVLHPTARAAVALAHEIGAVAVAKAVENTAELDTLRALGFDRAFGHAYSPALTPDGLAALLGA
jgi:EAL domain-containing protein (putative c-di-GMP-specific phosphodiesterase class I)